MDSKSHVKARPRLSLKCYTLYLAEEELTTASGMTQDIRILRLNLVDMNVNWIDRHTQRGLEVRYKFSVLIMYVAVVMT